MMLLEDKLIGNFKLTMNMVRGEVRKFVYDTHRLAILKKDLVGLCVADNW